jgi:hypothetical protein
LLLNEKVFAAALTVIILLIMLIWILLRKTVVTVPQLTLAITPVTPPGQYDHGATVNVTGTDLLDVGPPTVPAVGDTITLNLTDSAETQFVAVATTTVASDGTWAASFAVPANAAAGQATLTATDPKTGATATATFTQKKSIQMNYKREITVVMMLPKTPITAMRTNALSRDRHLLFFD